MVPTLEDRLVIGDETVLRELFEQFGSLVLGVGRRLVGDEAETLVRRVFVAAWRDRERFNPSRGSLVAWLSGITRREAVDQLRSSDRRSMVPSAEVGELEAVQPMVDRVVDRLVVALALDALPPSRREVVALCFFDDLSHAEIAQRLDLPLGTVKSHVRRGLETLQRELEDSRALV